MRRLLLVAGVFAGLIAGGPGFAAESGSVHKVPAEGAPATAPKVSARAMDLSKRYVTAMKVSESMASVLDRLGPMVAEESQDMPADEAKALEEATREALTAAMPRYLEQLTRNYAATYSEDELQALVTFYESPMGQAVLAKSRNGPGSGSEAVADLLSQVIEDAEGRFCAKVGCEPPVDIGADRQRS
jgi:hypothetical protein